MILIYVQARRDGLGGERRASLRELLLATRGAIIPMMMPVIIFGAILGGIADPTEAAVLAVFYAFIVGVFVYKEIAWADLPKIIVDSAVTSGVVIFMVGCASSFSWILASEQVRPRSPRDAGDLAGAVGLLRRQHRGLHRAGRDPRRAARHHHLPPDLRARSRVKLGIDPLHYSIIVVAAIGLGLFLPPVGLGLYIASSFANIRVDQTFRAMGPYVLVLFLGILVLIAFPSLTLVVPQAFYSP